MVGLFLSNVCFAITTIGHKFALAKLPPFFYTTLRMLLPGVFSLSYHLLRDRDALMSRFYSERKALLIIVLISTLIPLTLKAFALPYISTAKFAVLSSIDPFVAAFWASLLFGELLSHRQLLSLVLAALSVVLVLGDRSSGFVFGVLSLADVAVIVAVFLGKFGWALTQPIIKKRSVGSGEMNAVVMFTAGLLSLFFSGLFGEFSKLGFVTDFGFMILVVINVFINAVGYYLFTESLRGNSFTLVSVVGCSIPVMVAVLGYLFLGELLSVNVFVAIALNCLAVRSFVAGGGSSCKGIKKGE